VKAAHLAHFKKRLRAVHLCTLLKELKVKWRVDLKRVFEV